MERVMRLFTMSGGSSCVAEESEGCPKVPSVDGCSVSLREGDESPDVLD